MRTHLHSSLPAMLYICVALCSSSPLPVLPFAHLALDQVFFEDPFLIKPFRMILYQSYILAIFNGFLHPSLPQSRSIIYNIYYTYNSTLHGYIYMQTIILYVCTIVCTYVYYLQYVHMHQILINYSTGQYNNKVTNKLSNVKNVY